MAMVYTSEAELTPERLNANNNLLLHGKGDERFSSTHSFTSGLVLEGGYYFQVSNALVQPLPAEGGHRDTFMRSDFFYADGDPIKWPQPLNHNDFYLAAIPTACFDHPDPAYSILYSSTVAGTHSYISDSTSHFARLDPRGIAAIKAVHKHVENRVADYFKTAEFRKDPHSKQHIINNRRSYAASFSTRLLEQPMTEFEMRRCLAEFQRFTLDVVAALDWDTVYRPRIEGRHPPASKVDYRMGVFTQDPTMVEACIKAGLPFYYVQDHHNLAHTRIDTLAEIRNPQEVLVFAEGRVKFPTIFKGKANDANRLAQILYNSRHVLHSANIFACNYNPPPPRSNPPRSLNNAERNADTHRGIQVAYHPYRSTTISTQQHANLSASVIIDPVISPLLPGVLPSWAAALKAVDRANFPTSLPTDRGYAFPFISLFFDQGAQTFKRLMVFRWMLMRDVMLFRVGPGGPPSLACPIPNRVWRRAVQMDPLTFPNLRTNPPKTRSAEEMCEALAFLDSSFRSCQAQAEAILQQPATWRGNIYQSPADLNDSVVKEVLWEVNELNFRYELLAMDRRFYTAPPSEAAPSNGSSQQDLKRDDHLLDCLVPSPLARAFHVVEFMQKSEGLAHADVRRRVPQLNHLSRLMAGWNPSPFTVFDKLDITDSPDTLLNMEFELYKYYATRFFGHFGRAPVFPRFM